MTPERWTQVEELFHRAADCEAKNVAALLDKACHEDPALRREVEALLLGDQSVSDDLQEAVQNHLGTVGFPLIGETISHYSILEGLGGGGMGLVYVGEDIKLGRRVALKFLSHDAARNSEALKRFEREARSASALEHPNICPVYEFGHHEGHPFLVMQLLEGQTLREYITGAGHPQRLELGRLLDLAIQITQGLEAAHAHGIIHRDIKPANIFVTNQGQAKILDFGLAKLAGASSTTEGLQTNPSSNAAGGKSSLDDQMREAPDPFLSRTGVAMGTAGYMSPEQARGEELDARTDLFSFGLVLYEMATGRRAFQGDTGPVLHDAILRSKPGRVRDLNPQIPAKLEALIHKALEKDRGARYQSASELAADLKSLSVELQPKSLALWALAGAAGVVALSLIAIVVWFSRRQPQGVPDLKLRQLTTNSSEDPVLSGAISPDGKYLAYADIKGMHVKLIETGETRAVPQPIGIEKAEVAWEIFGTAWFPDGTKFLANAHPSTLDSVHWTSENSSIWMVSVLGSAPRRLRDRAIAWSVSPDGSSISFGTNKGKIGEREIWLMAPGGDQARKLFDSDENTAIGGLHWSSDGQRVIYVRSNEGGDTFVTRDLKGGPPTTLFSPSETKNMTDGMWLPDGRMIYGISEPPAIGNTCNYWTMRIDPRTFVPTEKSRRLTNWTGFCMDNTSVTADGKRLTFKKGAVHLTGYIADLKIGGKLLLAPRHFTLSESQDDPADWTADSKSLIFWSNRSGKPGIYKQSLDSDQAELVVTGQDGLRNPRVSPDGNWIVYLQDMRPGIQSTPRLVMRVPISGGSPQLIFTAGPGSLSHCARAPSRVCAIAEPTGDREQLILSALDPLEGRGPQLTRFDIDPDWEYWDFDISADGTRIAFLKTRQDPISILSLRTRALQKIKVKGWNRLETLRWTADAKGFFVVNSTQAGPILLHVDLQGNASVVREHVGLEEVVPSPDGRHLAFMDSTTEGNIWMMENF